MSNLPGQQPGYPPQGYVTPPMQHGNYSHAPQQPLGAPPLMYQFDHAQQIPHDHGDPPHGQQPGNGQPPPGTVTGMPAHGRYPPTRPSPGYDPMDKLHGNLGLEAEALRKAIKGAGTDNEVLIRILTKYDPRQMALLRDTYTRDIGKDLEVNVNDDTSGDFREVMVGLVAGPLMQDVYKLKEATMMKRAIRPKAATKSKDAIKQIRTNEAMLNDILIGRSNSDLYFIKMQYQTTWTTTLQADIDEDLGGRAAQLFTMILSATRAEDSTPILPDMLTQDVGRLLQMIVHGRIDSMSVGVILASKSDEQIRGIVDILKQNHQIDLAGMLKGSGNGHLEDAVLLMVNRACDRAMTDAVQLEDALNGKNHPLLLNRILRIHWSRPHLDQVKRAYQYRFGKDLIKRVKSETRFKFKRALVACLEGESCHTTEMI